MINASSLPVKTTQTDFVTKQVLFQGGNPVTGAPAAWLLVTSVGALNDKSALLRDSFGTSLSPLMAATFKEVLQLHWGHAIKPGGSFAQLVDEWKPITSLSEVERCAIFGDFGTDTVIMIPDKHLARNVAAQTGVKVITWEGYFAKCMSGHGAGNPRL